MLAVVAALWQRFRPAPRGETDLEYCRRRYPHLIVEHWTDGTD